jgi:hypothetical protein
MFQNAGSKGDGGGNGSGGMYFGDGGEEQEQHSYGGYDDNFGWSSSDTSDIPFTTPLFGQTPQGLASWKLALAKTLYEQIKTLPAS